MDGIGKMVFGYRISANHWYACMSRWPLSGVVIWLSEQRETYQINVLFLIVGILVSTPMVIWLFSATGIDLQFIGNQPSADGGLTQIEKFNTRCPLCVRDNGIELSRFWCGRSAVNGKIDFVRGCGLWSGFRDEIRVLYVRPITRERNWKLFIFRERSWR